MFQDTPFYGILDTGYVSPEDLVTKCKALIHGGAGIIQLRAKKESSAEKEAILQKILPLFEAIETPLILNDDLTLALKYPRVGLHIGQDDVSVIEARETLGPDRILGLSTHSPKQAAGALALQAQLDYFAVGPVFATQTKPDYTPVGLELVSHVAQLNPTLPWFCIGGIKQSNTAQVIAAGGQRIVVVSEVLCADDTASAVKQFKTLLTAS